jgi:hypothetical protein
MRKQYTYKNDNRKNEQLDVPSFGLYVYDIDE